jgi:hypothetical protein
MSLISSGVALLATIPRQSPNIPLDTLIQSCATNVMWSKNKKGAAKKTIMRRILLTNALYVTTRMHQKTLAGLTNPPGFCV